MINRSIKMFASDYNYLMTLRQEKENQDTKNILETTFIKQITNIILNYTGNDKLSMVISKGEELVFPKVMKACDNFQYLAKHWKQIEKIYLHEYSKFMGNRYTLWNHLGEDMVIYFPKEFRDIQETISIYLTSDKYKDIRNKIDNSEKDIAYGEYVYYHFS
jgi:hypothetical protein